MIHSKKLMKIKLLDTSQANFNKRLNDHLSFKQGNYESVEKTVNKILKKINQIDEELEKVKNNIISIKASYEKDISDLKNNINFFEQSIALINNIKGKE